MKSESKSRNKDQKEKRKIITIFFSFFFFLLILVGSVFGLLNYSNPNHYQVSSNFKNYYQFEIGVDWKSVDVNQEKEIYKLANYFNDQLEQNKDYYNSEVYVVDDDTILINMPITSIKNGNYGDELVDKPFSDDAQISLLEEIIYLQATLINQSYLEFRSYNGELLFPDGQQFVEPPITNSEDVSSYENNLEATNSQGNLIEKAEVDYSQGNPYIKIYPKDSAIFRDALSWYEEQAASGLSSDPNAIYWTIWFDYSQLENILLEGTDQGIFDYVPSDYDPTGEQPQENVYTYTHKDSEGNPTQELTKKIAEPYFVTIGQIQNNSSSVYNDYFAITGDFTVAKANNIVERINFSNTEQYFDLEIENYNLIYQNNSIKDLGWIFWLFITFVILVAFFFFIWFGLLGVIASSNNLLFGLLFSYFIYLFALPISFALIAALFIIVLISSLFTFYLLQRYKKIDNKLWNHKTKYKKIMQEFSIAFLPSIFVILISFLIGGILLPISVQLFIYFLVFAIFYFLIINYLILPLIIFLIDSITNFTDITFTKESKIWNYFIGINEERIFKNNKFYNDKKLIKVQKNTNSFKVLFILTMISSILFGAAFTLNHYKNGSGVNTRFLNDSYYRYDIVKTYQTSTKDTYASYQDSDELTSIERLQDPQNQKDHIRELKENIDDIIDIFEENNVNVNHYQIIRYDKLIYQNTYKPDENEESTIVHYDYQFTYGIAIYSSTEITEEMFLAINNDLYQNIYNTADEQYNLKYAYYGQLQNSPIYYDYQYYYQLIPTSSLSIANDDWRTYYKDSYDNNSSNLNQQEGIILAPTIYFNDLNLLDYSVNNLKDTTLNYQTLNIFLAILLILISFFFFGVIMYRFAVTISSLITVILEVLFAITFTLLIFTPFANMIIFAILLSIFMSFFAKFLILKKTEEQEYKFKDHFLLVIFLLFILNFLLSIFAMIILGKISLIIFVYTIIFTIISLISTIFVYPTIVNKLERRFKENKNRRKERDQILAKQEDVVIEEIIEGIND